MVVVQVSDYANFDQALQKFKKKVRKAHILETAHKKSYYISPSERRHKNRYRKQRF